MAEEAILFYQKAIHAYYTSLDLSQLKHILDMVDQDTDEMLCHSPNREKVKATVFEHNGKVVVVLMS